MQVSTLTYGACPHMVATDTTQRERERQKPLDSARSNLCVRKYTTHTTTPHWRCLAGKGRVIIGIIEKDNGHVMG